MKSPVSKTLVFVVDDDPAHNTLMNHVLKKYGLRGETFTTFDSLLNRIKTQIPALFMLDLNLEALNKGYELIEVIRAKYSETVPILVVSGNTDLTAIAHAIEIGANDYILKPLDRNVLLSKLTSYVNTLELDMAQVTGARSLEGALKVTAKLQVQLVGIDEMGLTLSSSHLIPKGTVLSVSGAILDEILETPSQILVTAVSSSIARDSNRFVTYAEFDPSRAEIVSHARNWIVRQS